MIRLFSQMIGYNTLNSLRYVPRTAVFFIELSLAAFAFVLNYLILSQSNIDYSTVYPFGIRFSLFILSIAGCFLLFGTHRASIRFTGIKDIIRLFVALSLAIIILAVLNLVYHRYTDRFIFKFTGLAYSGIISLLFLAVFRVSIKYMYIRLKYVTQVKAKRSLLMVGTDHENISIVKAINYAEKGSVQFTGFLSFDKSSKHLQIIGLNIFYIHNFYNIFPAKRKLDGIVLLDHNKNDEETATLLEYCVQHKIQIYHSSISRIIDHRGNENLQFKKADLEDLLFRDAIEINKDQVDIFLRDKSVMVTGAAGSIGSELSRQICKFGPKKLVLLDTAETPLFYIENELREANPDVDIRAVLGDVGDIRGMHQVFKHQKPDVVLHAAAYKHVPMMEKNPDKAFRVNFTGTKNIIDLCIRFGVSRMVQISTDKAVNPTNIMGLTKRLAELYLQMKIRQMKEDKYQEYNTQIIITRFGNVLGSNGSVVPVFEKQIREGKPITITDPEMTRYFMTIPEASSLVLQAATSGQSGEILIFDMGKPVKIIDMAEKLIRLNGLVPYEDIKILVTGKRPGEKLYEELFDQNCSPLSTSHPKIFKVIEDIQEMDTVTSLFGDLDKILLQGDVDRMMIIAQTLVPEYSASQNGTLAHIYRA